MGDDSLLDLMVQDHAHRETVAPVKKATESRAASEIDRMRQAAVVAARQAEMREAEARTAKRAAEKAPEIAGFREGMRFEMRRCGAEIDGLWVVHRIDAGAAGDPSRRMYGARADGRPGFLPLTERKAQDLLHAGLMIRQR
ncbi:MAG: hypothetical protein KC620_22240 [Myxococcales bacterium]|nr:hypothetical protein [Myxococcales bacterium]